MYYIYIILWVYFHSYTPTLVHYVSLDLSVFAYLPLLYFPSLLFSFLYSLPPSLYLFLSPSLTLSPFLILFLPLLLSPLSPKRSPREMILDQDATINIFRQKYPKAKEEMEDRLQVN